MDNIHYSAKYGIQLKDDTIECHLCPRHCKIRDGQRGFCFVRINHKGQFVLDTYGRSSGFAIDPIEKKPLNHFLPGTTVFSLGTAGCNLACKFCQNSSISHVKNVDRLNQTASPCAIAAKAKELGCPSVAYTYNEPLIFLEYALDIAKECCKLGIKNVAVSAGFAEKQAREDFFSKMDAANVDLKAFSDKFYHKFCAASLNPVLETLVYIAKETKCHLEITTLLIPNQNDSDEEIDAMTNWIIKNLGKNIPLHFTAYHPAHRFLKEAPTSLETLVKARDIALKNGLYYVYTGNIRSKEYSSTFCHNCGALLIERDGYNIEKINLDADAKCLKCKTRLHGIF
ncbi:MAG: AmmeMemoRadiSam system radical SAM enzyme [Alphaproteobacteria bacterium]